jgi:prepilin peptidase CpaA
MLSSDEHSTADRTFMPHYNKMTYLSPASLVSGHALLINAALCASVAAAIDLRTRRIPNILTAPAFALGLLLHFAAGGWKGMGLAGMAGIAGGVVFLFFFLAGGMGAGDVKLMAAVSAIAGPSHVIELLLTTAIAGGVLALGIAAARGRLRATLGNVGTLIGHHGSMGLMPHPDLNVQTPGTLRLPYGIAIAAGCWLTLLAPGVIG